MVTKPDPPRDVTTTERRSSDSEPTFAVERYLHIPSLKAWGVIVDEPGESTFALRDFTFFLGELYFSSHSASVVVTEACRTIVTQRLAPTPDRKSITFTATNLDLRLDQADDTSLGFVDATLRVDDGELFLRNGSVLRRYFPEAIVEIRSSCAHGSILDYSVDTDKSVSLSLTWDEEGRPEAVCFKNAGTLHLNRPSQWLTVTDGLCCLEMNRADRNRAAVRLAGVSLQGCVSGIEFSGVEDIGVEFQLNTATRFSSIGGKLTVDDGRSKLIGNGLGADIVFDENNFFQTLSTRFGSGKFESPNFGALTFMGMNTLKLTYVNLQLNRVETDAEELAWLPTNGSKIDARNALACLAFEETWHKARASLDSGVLAWQGAGDVEVTSYGFGACIELHSDGTVNAAAGSEGMTVHSPAGIAQLDSGILRVFYGKSEYHAVLWANRCDYDVYDARFKLEKATIDIQRELDQGHVVTFQGTALDYDHEDVSVCVEHGKIGLEIAQDGVSTFRAETVGNGISMQTEHFLVREASSALWEFHDGVWVTSKVRGRTEWRNRCPLDVDGEIAFGPTDPTQLHLFRGEIRQLETSTSVDALARITGQDLLLSLNSEGRLVHCALLGAGARLRSSMAELHSTEGPASLNCSEQIRIAAEGTAQLRLASGLAMVVERGQIRFDGPGESYGRVCIEHGRAQLLGEFGRLTLPAGFCLQTERRGRLLCVSGSTPNTVLPKSRGLSTVNLLALQLENDHEGFRRLRAQGSISIDHPKRQLRLNNGHLAIDYEREHQRLIYRGDPKALRFIGDKPTLHETSRDNESDLWIQIEAPTEMTS